MIHHIRHNEIDREAWDQCIAGSQSPLPYALTWWLDIVSSNWEALVDDGYRAVMPLPARKRFGLRYLMQPILCQQLGMFYRSGPPPDVGTFLAAVPPEFRYSVLLLNSANSPHPHQFQISWRTNHVLSLQPGPEDIEKQYHRNCRRNIKKAADAGLQVHNGPAPAEFAEFVRHNLDERLPSSRKELYTILNRLASATLEKQIGEITGVYDEANRLEAAGWFVTWGGRCLFLVCASTETGREKKAMYLLVDEMIRRKSASGLEFDFSGSNLPGIAYFNSGFGATAIRYPAVTINRLPLWMRWMKR